MKKILALLTVAILALAVWAACADNELEANQPTDGQAVNTENTVIDPAIVTIENVTEATPLADENPTEEKKTEEAKSESPTAKTEKKTEPAKKTEGKITVTTTKADTEVKITKEEAKEAVLKHAGLNENEISIYKIELDRERIGPVYEIELYTGKYEYEYEVNAETGKIIKGEKESRD